MKQEKEKERERKREKGIIHHEVWMFIIVLDCNHIIVNVMRWDGAETKQRYI